MGQLTQLFKLELRQVWQLLMVEHTKQALFTKKALL